MRGSSESCHLTCKHSPLVFIVIFLFEPITCIYTVVMAKVLTPALCNFVRMEKALHGLMLLHFFYSCFNLLFFTFFLSSPWARGVLDRHVRFCWFTSCYYIDLRTFKNFLLPIMSALNILAIECVNFGSYALLCRCWRCTVWAVGYSAKNVDSFSAGETRNRCEGSKGAWPRESLVVAP